MGAKGFVAVQDGHFVPLIIPHDTNGAAHNSPVIRMKFYNHASVFVMYGASSRAAGVLTIESCLDMTPSVSTAIGFTSSRCNTAFGSANDDLASALAAVAATGVTPSAAVTGCWINIEVEAENLVANHIGFRLCMVDPGAACVMAAFAILSGNRYGRDASPTVDA